MEALLILPISLAALIFPVIIFKRLRRSSRLPDYRTGFTHPATV